MLRVRLWPPSPCAHPRTAGQATPLMAGVLALAGLIGLVLVGGAAHLVDEAQARSAADAAALAGAAEGRAAAVGLARANGARLTAFEARGSDVVVTVRVGRAEVRARARAEAPSGRGATPNNGPASRTLGGNVP